MHASESEIGAVRFYLETVVTGLTHFGNTKPKGFKYLCVPDYILRNGRDYTYTGELTPEPPPGVLKGDTPPLVIARRSGVPSPQKRKEVSMREDPFSLMRTCAVDPQPNTGKETKSWKTIICSKS